MPSPPPPPQNLHAHEGAIHLASGAIKGSFNVSRELILHTTIGAIEANVSIFAHPHHKKGKHNATAEVELERADESDDKRASLSRCSPFRRLCVRLG